MGKHGKNGKTKSLQPLEAPVELYERRFDLAELKKSINGNGEQAAMMKGFTDSIMAMATAIATRPTEVTINQEPSHITLEQQPINIPAANVTVNVPEQKPPNVTVNVPQAAAPVVTVTPNINVEPAKVTVNVPQQKAGDVVVNVPKQDAPKVEVTVNPELKIERPNLIGATVVRDAEGKITGIEPKK